MSKHAASFLAGVVFAVGLGISGMTQPQKVLAFLDISGRWDPSLAFVMAGAVATNFLLIWIGKRFSKPGAEPLTDVQASLGIPPPGKVGHAVAALRDPRLMAGAGMFGAGWGLVGFCPGPAVVSLTSGLTKPVLFTAAMVAGMLAYRYAGPLLHVLRGGAAGALAAPTPPQECGTV